MSDPFLPIDSLAAVDIRDVKVPGLILPVKKNGFVTLVTDWHGSPHAVFLNGQFEYSFFAIKSDHSQEGLFVAHPVILVDHNSAESGTYNDLRLGDLLLEGDKVSIMAKRVNDSFADPVSVPLWPAPSLGSEGARIRFPRWKIGVHLNNSFAVLWERAVRA